MYKKKVFSILICCFIFSLLITGQFNGAQAGIKSSGAGHQYIIDAYTEPLVHISGKETFSFLIKVKDTSIKSIYIPFKPSPYKRNGTRLDTLQLFNDGTHGDKITNDSLFTLDGLTRNSYANSPVDYFYFNSHEVIYEFKNGQKVSTTEYLELIVLSINDELVPVPGVIKIYSDSVIATEYAVSIKQKYKNEFPDFDKDDKELVKTFYKYFPDEINFFLFPVLYTSSRLGGSHATIKNYVRGTGSKVFDNSASFGSNGNLLAVINIFHHFDKISVINHELLHQWGVYTNEKLMLNKKGDSHWGIIEMESTGFGTSDIVKNIVPLSDTTFYTIKHPALLNKCSSLEMYLMGFLPLDSVSFPIKALVNPVIIGDYNGNSMYRADALKYVTKEEFISLQGERIPGYLNEKKNFNVAVVIPYERVLNKVEMAYFDFIAREIEKDFTVLKSGETFRQITRGAGSINTRLNPLNISSFKTEKLPAESYLEQNYPNPFNPATTIRYSIKTACNVTLKIFDLLGREVVTLVNEYKQPGIYNSEFQSDRQGSIHNSSSESLTNQCAGGIYFYQLQAGSYSETKKMLLLK
jgi:hypothetical protein